MTKVGDVLVNKTGRYVITHMDQGQVVDTEPLEDFIIENVSIPYNGEHRTIKEIIETECKEHLKIVETINE